MFVELHMLQNFAPSNLNRDDTGSPKDCEFGGYRRARISSQAIKKAMRTAFKERELVPEEHRAERTKRLSEAMVERFIGAGKSPDEAEAVVAAAIQGLGLKFQPDKDPDADRKTQYLLFLGQREIAALVDVCLQNWEVLQAVAPGAATGAGRAAKRAASASVPKHVQDALKAVLDGGKAADVALFGRMIADLPEKNVDAASQVAHAISTNRVSTEFDFYTAVDDLKPEDTEGADMLGTVEFNSSCFYRYANVDLAQLGENLGGDDKLARDTLEAFLRASALAIPTGKQNSMAAQNPPSFMLAVLRDTGLWSLSNAFLRPVHPDRSRDLIDQSEEALDAYWSRLESVYGSQGILGKWYVSLNGDGISALRDAQVNTFDQLVDAVLTSASFQPARNGNRT